MSDIITQSSREPQQRYTAQEEHMGLTALARCHGSSRAAERMLAESGVQIPEATLRGWKQRKEAELRKVEKQVEDEIYANTSRHFKAVVEKATKAAASALDKAQNAIDEDDSKQARAWSSTSVSLITTSGIAHDKTSAIDGRPTVIHEARGLKEIANHIKARHGGILRVVNAEAVEVTADSGADVDGDSVTDGGADQARPPRRTHANSQKPPAPGSPGPALPAGQQ